MTQLAFAPSASGTGSVTIAAPTTNSARTITLPDATGTLLLANGDGSALTNLPVLGIGQTWQNFTGSRAVATTYTNSTGKPIQVCIYGNNASTSVTLQVSFDGGTTFMTFAACALPSGTAIAAGTFVVPVGGTYRVGGFTTVTSWWELR